jgi:hypothetical protein
MPSDVFEAQQIGMLIGSIVLVIGCGVAVVLVLMSVRRRARSLGIIGLLLVLLGFYGPSIAALFAPIGALASGGVAEWLTVLPFALVLMIGFFFLARAVAASGRDRVDDPRRAR